jgi:hypothetical protein
MSVSGSSVGTYTQLIPLCYLATVRIPVPAKEEIGCFLTRYDSWRRSGSQSP